MEVSSQDLCATKRFFSQLFNWIITDHGADYTSLTNEVFDGGFCRAHLSVSYRPALALVVFYIDNIEKTFTEVESAYGPILRQILYFRVVVGFTFLNLVQMSLLNGPVHSEW